MHPTKQITAAEMGRRRWANVSTAERSRLMRAASAKAAAARTAKAKARKALVKSA